MKEFVGKGRITYEGVWFYVVAETIEEARELIFKGEFSADLDEAEAVDWEVSLASIKENA